MNVIARPAALLLLIFTLLTSPTLAQKRQTPAKPQPKPAAAPSPAPTFDNLLPADAYVLYIEVRDAGQLIHSSAIKDLLEPVLKFVAPKDSMALMDWLNTHAEQMMSARMFFANGNVNKNVPEIFVAVEFASPEEAAKFATPLNEFLPKVLPPGSAPESATKNAAPKPRFNGERLSSLVVITERPWTMKQLRPAGSKSLAEEVNFRTARNRFNSEPLFAYVDFKLMNKQDEEHLKRAEEEQRKVEEQAKQTKAQEKRDREETTTPEAEATTEKLEVTRELRVLSSEPAKEAPTPDPVSTALSQLGDSLFGGESHLPDAMGIALSYEGESFDLRTLLLSAPGEKSDAVPFWPRVITGAAIAPEAPGIFPADTELFATMSLDLPQIYSAMSKPSRPEFTVSKGEPSFLPRPKIESPPFKTIEKQLGISIENDLLPLLGGEVAVGLPMEGLNILGIAGPPPPAPEKKENENEPANTHGPIVAISIKDKDGMRELMPKLIEKLGFKGASQFAATERREDTELVSYANFFAYAFVGNFLVLSSDAATVRHVVDSYLKQETLASDNQFRTSTRWQPRQLHGQIYISPALMEGFRVLARQSSMSMGDQTRNLLANLSTVGQPVTYSLSNEGFGPLHELHVPKNLVAMLQATISSELNPPPLVQNERMAIAIIYQLVSVEEQYKTKQGGGSYGTLDDLVAAGLFPKETLEKSGYKFEVIVNADNFEVSATPLEYGKSGSLSLFLDRERVLRGGDRNGAAATAADPRFPD